NEMNRQIEASGALLHKLEADPFSPRDEEFAALLQQYDLPFSATTLQQHCIPAGLSYAVFRRWLVEKLTAVDEQDEGWTRDEDAREVEESDEADAEMSDAEDQSMD